MTKDLEAKRNEVTLRIGKVLCEIILSESELDIEAKFHLIGSLAKDGYETFHEENCISHHCNHTFMEVKK